MNPIYISRSEDMKPMALRRSPTDLYEGPQPSVAEFVNNFNQTTEFAGLRPSYSYFTPRDDERARFQRVIDNPNMYTFFTGNGLSYSYYLFNSPIQGLVIIFQSNGDDFGWYKVTQEEILNH